MVKNGNVWAINSKSYWEHRFHSGDWKNRGGPEQTRLFAEEQVRLLGLSRDFAGTILDFGCGTGDAFPVYRRHMPMAKLIGVDISARAIEICQEKYGEFATFICGSHEVVPNVDVIIVSNVLEHLQDCYEVLERLLVRCSVCFVIVPYRERIRGEGEHVRSFDENSFARFKPRRSLIYKSKGWTEFGWQLFLDVYLKNVVRFALGRPIRRRRLQVMFELPGWRKDLGDTAR